jgi:hypothetical protein
MNKKKKRKEKKKLLLLLILNYYYNIFFHFFILSFIIKQDVTPKGHDRGGVEQELLPLFPGHKGHRGGP